MRWEQLRKLHWTQLREMQEARLREFVTHQLPFSAFYREYFDRAGVDFEQVRTLDDLRRLPFTTKRDLFDESESTQISREFILEPSEELIRERWTRSTQLKLFAKKVTKGQAAVRDELEVQYKPIFFTATTGRSSASVRFFYAQPDLDNLAESGRRIMNVAQVSKDWKALNMFPYAPHLAFWQVHYAALAGRVLALSSGGGKCMSTQSHVDIMEKLQPELLVGVPSYVYHVLRTAHEQGRDLHGIRRIVLGAEKVPQGMKEKMLSLLADMRAEAEKVRICGTYGFTEAKRAWVEAPASHDVSTGYYTYPDLELFEVVNPKTGDPVAEGEDGEIVYTTLNARGSVVLRYRTGDLVKGGLIHSEPCPHTGLTVPRLSSTITRVSSEKDVRLTKVKGTFVNLDSLAHTLMGAKEIEEWALEIRKENEDPYGLDELTLYVAPRHGVSADEDLKNKLAERMKVATEVRPNRVVFESLEVLSSRVGLETQLKETRFFDRREEARVATAREPERKREARRPEPAASESTVG